MQFVYLLQSETDQSFYIGCTADIKRRVKEHNRGNVASTKHHAPYKLLYFEAFASKTHALKREKQLKRRASAYVGLMKRLGFDKKPS